jgi:hypothetical protein
MWGTKVWQIKLEYTWEILNHSFDRKKSKSINRCMIPWYNIAPDNFRFLKYSHKIGTINVIMLQFSFIYRITKFTCAQLVNACQLQIVILVRQCGANAKFPNDVILIATAHAQSLSMCFPSAGYTQHNVHDCAIVSCKHTTLDPK